MKLNNQSLRLAWHKPATTLSTVDPDEAEPEEEEVCGIFTQFVFIDAPLVELCVLLHPVEMAGSHQEGVLTTPAASYNLNWEFVVT